MRQKDDRRFAETANESSRRSLRELCDKASRLLVALSCRLTPASQSLEAGKSSISEGLPDFILSVTDMIKRSRDDPEFPFHRSHDPLAGDYVAQIRADAAEAAKKADEQSLAGLKCEHFVALRAACKSFLAQCRDVR